MNRRLTFIDLFAGIGGFRRGMELAGHKCMGFCEWDKFATASYTSMHLITDEQRQKLAGMSLKERQKEILKDEYRNGEWYSPDIRQVGAGNVPRVDCWCFGAPCLVAGTLITTKEGMKPIEEVRVGDMVLTHANTFEPVTERMVNRKKGIYTLKVMGSPITEVTGNHRFYVRYRKKVWDNSARNWKTKWTDPEWKAVENFTGKEYIEFPNSRDEGVNCYNLTSEEERLEIFANIPKLRDIYNRLAEYEDTGLTPDEIKNRKMISMTFESISISPKAERAMIGVENALLYQIKKLKSCVKSDNSDYLKGYLCALSAVEGIIEEGKSENNDQT